MKSSHKHLMSHRSRNLARRLAHIIVAGFLLLCSSHGSAADSVTFSALCFSPSSATEPAFYVGINGARKKINVPVTSLGGPFQANVRDGRMLDFFTNESDERPAVSVQLPSGSSDRLLVVFVPQGGSYQARALTLPASGFGGGTTFAINLSPTEVAIRHGNTPQQSIKPSGQQLLTLPSGYREPMLPVQIFMRNSTGTWEIAQSTRWPIDNRFRTYLFFYRSKETEPIGVHAVPERLSDT